MLFSHSVICLVIRCQRILWRPFAIFITYPVMDIFKNLWKRHVFLFLVLSHLCHLLSRSPYTLLVCLVCHIFRNTYSLCIHFCSLCFVLLSLSSWNLSYSLINNSTTTNSVVPIRENVKIMYLHQSVSFSISSSSWGKGSWVRAPLCVKWLTNQFSWYKLIRMPGFFRISAGVSTYNS